MSFKSNLKNKLKEKLNEKELELLPSGFQFLEDLIILNLKPELVKKTEYKEIIGKSVLDLFPKIRIVCNKKGEIKGEFRQPQIEVIAKRDSIDGKKEGTEVIVKENNCLYKFDAVKLMFAKGNINERVRIAKQVKKGEIVLDMFSGIGYFSIPIGKIGKPKKLYSIELNPIAFYYLCENIKLNHLANIIEAIHGDNRKIIEKLLEKGVKADRIVMGYLPPPKDFLSLAFKIAKKGTIIHYEDLLNYDKTKIDSEIKRSMKYISETGSKFGFKVNLIKANFVKDFKPHIGHYVLDVMAS